jgi:hypothetical protein
LTDKRLRQYKAAYLIYDVPYMKNELAQYDVVVDTDSHAGRAPFSKLGIRTAYIGAFVGSAILMCGGARIVPGHTVFGTLLLPKIISPQNAMILGPYLDLVVSGFLTVYTGYHALYVPHRARIDANKRQALLE